MNTSQVLTPPDAQPMVTPMIYGAIGMAMFTIAAVGTVTVLKPGDASIITTIVGISSPIILGLMAVGLNGIHRLANSNLSDVKTALQLATEKIEQLHEAALEKQRVDTAAQFARGDAREAEAAKMLASSALLRTGQRATDPPVAAIAPEVVNTLHRIEDSNAVIAENTQPPVVMKKE